MPKLLQKNICKRTIVVAIVVLLMIAFNLLNGKTVLFLFTGLNFIFWIERIANGIHGIHNNYLSDYMYIAPFSYEQRKNFIKISLLYDFYVSYLGILMLAIMPILVFAVIKGMKFLIIICITESILAFSLLYAGNYFEFLSRKNLSGVSVDLIYFIMFTLMSGLDGLTIVDIIIIICIIAVSVLLAIVCHKKYYELVTSYYTDYELSRQLVER